jgi:hypothetical protein
MCVCVFESLYTFSLYENPSFIIFSAETEYISTRSWYRNISFLRDRISRIFLSNMCSNIPASPAYGVYISQLIRYARVSSNYSDFLKRHLHLRNRLLDQGYKKIRLIRYFVQAFLKKWWVETDFKAPNLPFSLRLKVSGCHYNSIYNNT